MRLRGYGNSINVYVAAAFIRAYLATRAPPALQFLLIHNVVEKTKAGGWAMKRNTPPASTSGVPE